MTLNSFLEELLKLNISLTDKQVKQLQEYYQLLVEYNKVMNLTGITEEKDVYLKHFYDSLTLVKVCNINEIHTICDIGTGAGFPGMVIKIVYPDIQMTLVDSLNKRIGFLNIVIKTLGLEKVETIHARAEEFATKNREKYDMVTARAVAPLPILLEYAVPLVKVNGYFIPLKGTLENEPNYEHAMKVLNVELEEIEEFLLPIEKSHRSILKFKKIGKTPSKYPRTNAEMKKRAL